jgi:hypothetical protein
MKLVNDEVPNPESEREEKNLCDLKYASFELGW